MTLSLVSENGDVALDDLDGSLFELIKTLGIKTAEYRKIENNYYGTTHLSSNKQVLELLRETKMIRQSYVVKVSETLAKERRIRTRNKLVKDRILAQMLSGDKWIGKLDEIIKLCEDAIASGGRLICIGD